MSTPIPTKTSIFDDDVVQIIRGMRWNEAGTVGQIIQPLDRNMYIRVNKALEAMGGKWNRRTKGHVFNKDMRPEVGVFDGSLFVERDGFFQTPVPIVRQMLGYLNPSHGWRILEPSAGLGAIADIVFERCRNIDVCERNEERAGVLVEKGYNLVGYDFMEYNPGAVYNGIIMNPPFENGQDADHVMHAFTLLVPGGRLVSIMSEGVFFREHKKSLSFRQFFLDNSGIDHVLPEDAFKESGALVRTRLVFLQKQEGTKNPILDAPYQPSLL